MKAKALAQFLEVDVSGVREIHGDRSLFEVNKQEWLVLTESEAQRRAVDYIRDTMWAFNYSFIASHFRAGIRDSEQFEKAITKMQSMLCEDANEIIFGLIANFRSFAQQAIASDGRGHFLASYDSREEEVRYGKTTYYLYRVN